MSGIYIPGLKMPNINTAYAVLFRVNADGTAQLQGSYADDFGSYEAIPVHANGRLIEAERLKEVFHRNVAGGEAFDQLIDIAPTVIPAEEGEG